MAVLGFPADLAATVGEQSDSLVPLVAGSLFLALVIATLLVYRISLRHYDRQIVRVASNRLAFLHTSLRNRIARIDRWGASLTAILVVYAIMTLAVLMYQSFEKITQFFLRVLSIF